MLWKIENTLSICFIRALEDRKIIIHQVSVSHMLGGRKYTIYVFDTSWKGRDAGADLSGWLYTEKRVLDLLWL